MSANPSYVSTPSLILWKGDFCSFFFSQSLIIGGVDYSTNYNYHHNVMILRQMETISGANMCGDVAEVMS